MAGFNKIVPEIIQSSIWNEPSDIRVVWITMLATKDKDGYVRGDARTIARMANVSLESAEEALKRFQEPDPSSHTPDYEGRRIYHAPGGWMVINSDLYRETGMNESQREYWREKQKEHRAKKTQNVIDMSMTCLGHVLESDVSVSVSESVVINDKGVKGKKDDITFKGILYTSVFEAFWKFYPRKVARPQAEKAMSKALKRSTHESILAGYEKHLTAWEKCDKQFIPHAATWLNRDGWNDEPPEIKQSGQSTAQKAEKPIWKQCASRCRFWDENKRWCIKHEQNEPSTPDVCRHFN